MNEINPYFISHVHEGNILEIEYIIKELDFHNIVQADAAVRNEIRNLHKITSKKVILVLNLKNIKSIDFSTIGATINALNELKKCNGEKSKIYCINITEEIKETYKLLKLDYTLLLMNFNSIDDIIKQEMKK